MHDLYSGTHRAGDLRDAATRTTTSRGPAKIVPQAADGMPQVTDDGKDYTVKLTQGHLLPARPGVRRQEARAHRRRRRLLATSGSPIRRSARRGRSWSRASSSASTTRSPAAKKSGKFDYDKKIAGLEAVDRYTVRFRLKDTDYNLPYVLAHEPTRARRARGDREVRRVRRPRDEQSRSAPARTSSAQWVRSIEDRARRQSRLPRLHLGLHAGAARRREARRADEGQEDAAGRPRRDQHHGGGPGALARVPERRARPHEHGGPARAQRDRRRRQAQARARGQGRAPRPLRRPRDPLHVLEHARPASSAASARRRSRCAARSRCRTTSTRRSASSCNGQAVEATYPIPPGVVGHVPELEEHDQVRSRRAPMRCSTSSATSAAPTAIARFPTASRWSIKYASRPDTQNRQLEELVKKIVRRDRRAHGEPARTSSRSC